LRDHKIETWLLRHRRVVSRDQDYAQKDYAQYFIRAPSCVGGLPKMIGIIIALLSVLLPLVHFGCSRHPKTRGRVVHLLLLYALVLDVGVIGLVFGFIPHVFFADQAAHLIGWPPGSPFQFEVGIHDGAWGLLGFLSIWIGGSFWIATGLGWSVFMLGAAYGHLYQTLSEGNYAPYNFLTIFSDGFIAVWLLVLLYLYYRREGFQTQGQVGALEQQTR
jgi:Family of unknown function (DUF6790)